MELVRSYTTKQPPLRTASTLQKNITIYVLLTGIAGGLLLILAILLLCKYCSQSSSCHPASPLASNNQQSKSSNNLKVEYSATGHLSTTSSEAENFKEVRPIDLNSQGGGRTSQEGVKLHWATKSTVTAPGGASAASTNSASANQLSPYSTHISMENNGKDGPNRSNSATDSCVIQAISKINFISKLSCVK